VEAAAAPSRHPVGCNARRPRRREYRTEKKMCLKEVEKKKILYLCANLKVKIKVIEI